MKFGNDWQQTKRCHFRNAGEQFTVFQSTDDEFIPATFTYQLHPIFMVT
jgi:hypothetical protein